MAKENKQGTNPDQVDDEDLIEVVEADEATTQQADNDKPATTSAGEASPAPAADKAAGAVDVADSKPVGQTPPPASSGSSDTDDVPEEELRSYSAAVQQRIKKITGQRYHYKRRAENQEKQLNELIPVAKSAIEEVNRLRAYLHQGENAFKTTAKDKLEAQIAQAKQDYKVAYETGDADAVAKAQSRMSELHAELSATNRWVPAPPQQAELPPQMVQPPEATIDAQAQDWQSKNDWFGRDVEMTGFALGVHQRLVQSGVDPRSSSYYQTVDGEVRKRFPEKFGQTGPAAQAPADAGVQNVVAPATRGSGKPPRRVTLTASEIAIARRLGVTPTQYAEQKLQLNRTEA